jgi:hypothetical protein
VSAASARHMSRVAALGCALCRRLGYPDSPAQVHHPRMFSGAMQKKCSDFLTIPLCEPHHLGMHGIHGDRADFRNAGVDEPQLLADVIEQLTK